MKLTIPSLEVDDDRAVSPVIGVILMVAITVILAAVIGAFVLNLGQDIQNTTPQAIIQATDAGGNNFDNESSVDLAYINHQTGDDITINNLRIVVVNEDGAQVASLSSDNNFVATQGESGDEIDAKLGGTDLNELNKQSDTFSAGDQITLTYNDNNNTNFALSDNSQVTIRIIDTSSGGTVATSTFTLR